MTNRVLVIAYGGELKPSTRLRILQYLPALEDAGFSFDRLFVPQGQRQPSLSGLGEKLDRANVVFVQRVLERDLIRTLRRTGKPVIYDIDDALHLIRQSQYPRAAHPRGAVDRLKNAYRATVRGGRFYSGRKRLLDEMLEIAETTIVGNQWLFNELRLSDDRAVILPTSVWLEGVPTKTHEQHEPLTIGWIGVKSNLYHLQALDDTFTILGDRYPGGLELNIVSSAPMQTPLPTRFTQWSLESESDSVSSFDIGIMPLQDDPFSRGKCAFKAVFCMSRGIPVIASPVGANTALIEHGVNGWLATSTEEWIKGISALADDLHLRVRMSRLARTTIEERYSARHVVKEVGQLLRKLTGLAVTAVSDGRTT